MFNKESIVATLRSRGMRLTPQRLAVLDALGELRYSHPTADTVAKRVAEKVSGVSLSTIYKTLNELADLGLLRRVQIDGTTRFDPNVHMHAHLKCTDCNDVVDIDLPAGVAEALPSVESRYGVRIETASFDYTGACPKCVGAA